MENCILINGQEIELTEGQVKQIVEARGIQQKQLCDYEVGSIVKVGPFEMVVLEQFDGQTALILKGMYGEELQFGDTNNYDGSYVDEKCQAFAQELADRIGWKNIVLHKVDLTSDDGLKDYGVVERRTSLITTEMYRKYVDILDTVKPECWWWLATPFSTKKHRYDAAVKCVSPSGYFGYGLYGDVAGVRPFCILKSTIFVSK